MASVKLEHIYKVYTGGVKAVSDMTLDIKDGEFIVFVGPSGCGKSTTLRMIAGLEQISAGELYIGNQVVNDVEPKDRDIAMVFQNYALYPQMTVYENMAFGLKLRHIPSDVIQQKVMWAANILGLTEMLDRKPKAMSGGQRQRVALGRAILRDPKVMLLDEPLSNLDAKLRTSMRTEIAKLHQRLKTTFIYVTHDQTEAMTLGDRVVVMKKGTVQQFDTPKNLYEFPANKFVAGFIGTPQMNFFNGKIKRDGEIVKIKLDKSEKELETSYYDFIKVNPLYLDGKHDITMGIRCEHLHISTEETKASLPVRVTRFEELGSEALIYGEIDLNDEEMTDKEANIIIKVPSIPEDVQIGKIIHVSMDMDHTYFFDKETEETIVPRIPTVNKINCKIDSGENGEKYLSFLNAKLPLPKEAKIILGEKIVQDGILSIPNDAFRLDGGDIKATCLKTEIIGDVKLLHLDIGGRVVFALSDKEVPSNTDMNIGIDFSRISVSENSEEVIAPIDQFDSFNGNFYNLKTALSQTNNNQKFLDEKARREKEAVEKYDALIAQAHEDYKRDYENTIPEEFKNADRIEDPAARNNTYSELVKTRKEKAKLDLESLKKQKTESIAKLKHAKDDTLKDLKAKHKADVKEAKAKNNELYNGLRIQEKQSYEEFVKTNKDREALRRRKDEYRMFMSTFTDQKANALEERVKGIDINFDNEVSKVKATYKRGVNGAKQAYNEKKKFYATFVDPIKSLKAHYEKKYADLEKEKKNAIVMAGNVFLFNVNNYYFFSNSVISAKLIQGLGTKVFSKNYLIEVPHNAYSISEDDGIDAKVIHIADYENVKFVKVQYEDNFKQVHFASFETDKEFEIGQQIKIVFDITKCHITETGMNIRLY